MQLRLRRVAARSAAALLALAAVGTGLVATGGPARAALEVHWAQNGSFALSGLGDGHGHGMSQWGADGAAQEGLSAAQILNFYYPNTAASSMANITLRVLLSGVPSGEVEVQETPRDGENLKVYDYGYARSTALPTSVSGAAVSDWRAVSGGGVQALQGYWAGAWRAYPTTGPWITAGEIAFSGLGTNTESTLRADGDFRDYRGTVGIEPVSGGSEVVNNVSIEQYLDGVVPSESPSSWPAAALQSQAVAARTYADEEVDAARSYDICDNTECQEYRGRADYTPTGGLISDNEAASSDAAVAATTGQIRTYNGAPIFAQYSAADGGWTVASTEPYLTAEPDPYDGVVPNAAHSWTATLSATDVGATFGVGTAGSIVVNARDGDGAWGGRILSLTVQGSTGSATVSGDAFAADVGLESSWWTAPTGVPTTTQLTGTNLYMLNTNPGDGHVDLHMLTAASSYQQWAEHIVTALPPEPMANWRFFVGAYGGDNQPDLYAVCLVACGSGDVEVHVLTAASHYQTYAAHIATAARDFTSTADEQVAMAQYADDGQEDLFLIQTGATASGRVQLSALSAASRYATTLVSTSTGLSDADTSSGDWQFLVGDPAGHGDLVAVDDAGTTGSGRTEAHILSQSSGYQTFSAHDATAFSLNADPAFALGAYGGDGDADLFAVLPTAGTGHTEVHVLDAADRFSTFLAHILTIQSQTPPSQWALTLG